jgi:hypothetical protein
MVEASLVLCLPKELRDEREREKGNECEAEKEIVGHKEDCLAEKRGSPPVEKPRLP